MNVMNFRASTVVAQFEQDFFDAVRDASPYEQVELQLKEGELLRGSFIKNYVDYQQKKKIFVGLMEVIEPYIELTPVGSGFFTVDTRRAEPGESQKTGGSAKWHRDSSKTLITANHLATETLRGTVPLSRGRQRSGGHLSYGPEGVKGVIRDLSQMPDDNLQRYGLEIVRGEPGDVQVLNETCTHRSTSNDTDETINRVCVDVQLP